MTRKVRRFSVWILAAIFMLNVFLASLTNVPTHPTESDDVVFRTVLHLPKLQRSLTYEQELQLIRSVQDLVLKEAPGQTPIPEYQDREPADLFRTKSGLCYDRSRTLDKLLNWYGFRTRHVYILYAVHPATGERLPFWRAFFTKGTDSHAVTEVKTSLGWLVVDSNSLWISVAANGDPVGADHIHAQADRFASMPEYWNRPFWAIRGLYSRRGQFYRPYITFPELNWPDFLMWIVAE